MSYSNEQKLTQARAILSEWAQKQGHAKCWNHNEILQRLADLLDAPLTASSMKQPTREEFKLGCAAYWDFLYGPEEQEHKGGHIVGECESHKADVNPDLMLVDLRKLAEALEIERPTGSWGGPGWLVKLRQLAPGCAPPMPYWERSKWKGAVDPSVDPWFSERRPDMQPTSHPPVESEAYARSEHQHGAQEELVEPDYSKQRKPQQGETYCPNCFAVRPLGARCASCGFTGS